MRPALLLGNWKMHGSLRSNELLLRTLLPALQPLDMISVGLFPPALYLPQTLAQVRHAGIHVGAQHACAQANGPFTGEIAINMVAEVGCNYLLVGHSERRSLFRQSDAETSILFAAAQQADLVPVLCVGETLAERERDETLATVIRQLDAVVAGVGVKAFAKAVIAYEPVWAIGTGRSASPEEAQAVHAAIRNWLAMRDPVTAARVPILYGGSVKPENALALFRQPDIDGGLVGAASLDGDAFIAIARALDHTQQAVADHAAPYGAGQTRSAAQDC